MVDQLSPSSRWMTTLLTAYEPMLFTSHVTFYSIIMTTTYIYVCERTYIASQVYKYKYIYPCVYIYVFHIPTTFYYVYTSINIILKD